MFEHIIIILMGILFLIVLPIMSTIKYWNYNPYMKYALSLIWISYIVIFYEVLFPRDSYYLNNLKRVAKELGETMSVEEIKALNVASLADENCELYLWTTQKYLPDAFEVLKAWGFKYCQTLTWCKTPRALDKGEFIALQLNFYCLEERVKCQK